MALGALTRETGCHVQTHCSESDWEHGFVLQRCGVSDTEALDRFGLLTRHTVLAHGNFVGDEDVARIVDVGAGIAHCPLSNVYFLRRRVPAAPAAAAGRACGPWHRYRRRRESRLCSTMRARR